eukprot:3939412-Rhodomonas_salina.2
MKKTNSLAEKVYTTFNLLPIAMLAFVSTIIIVATAGAIRRDSEWASIPMVYPSVYSNPPYRKMIDFSDDHNPSTLFFWALSHSNESRQVTTSVADVVASLKQCPQSMGITTGHSDSFLTAFDHEDDSCEFLLLTTNVSQPKTLSMGIIQHPGFALIGYGIPGLFIMLSTVTSAASLAYRRLAIMGIVWFVSLLAVLAHSEIGDTAHTCLCTVMLVSAIGYHNVLLRKVWKWYKFRRLYQTSIWITALFHFVWLILCSQAWETQEYARFEVSTLSCFITLQFFASHILVMMSPVSISMRLPNPCCIQIEVGETPQVSPRDSEIGETKLETFANIERQASGTSGKQLMQHSQELTVHDTAKTASKASDV